MLYHANNHVSNLNHYQPTFQEVENKTQSEDEHLVKYKNRIKKIQDYNVCR